MDFLDIKNYENLMQIHKLNKDIHLLKLEINEFHDKKKSNIYFLNIQQELFDSVVKKKFNLLKKYNYRIIKNILNMHILKKKNKELIEIENNNINLINDINHKLLYYSIDKYNTKKSIEKILIKYNNIINNDFDLLKLEISKIQTISINNFKCKILKNLDNINYLVNTGLNTYYIFYSYLLNNNFYNDINLILNNHQQIYKQYILKYKLNIEYKEYLKYKQQSIQKIKKVQNINHKSEILKIKNNKRLTLLHQKTRNIKNKYLYIQKDIIVYENRNSKTQSVINKNIHELNIRISIKTKQLLECQQEIELCNKNIELLNELNGEDILTLIKKVNILTNKQCKKCTNNKICKTCLEYEIENCPICLDTINKGIMTSCNHFFHYGCINLYIFNILHQNSKLDITCPICRQYI